MKKNQASTIGHKSFSFRPSQNSCLFFGGSAPVTFSCPYFLLSGWAHHWRTAIDSVKGAILLLRREAICTLWCSHKFVSDSIRDDKYHDVVVRSKQFYQHHLAKKDDKTAPNESSKGDSSWSDFFIEEAGAWRPAVWSGRPRTRQDQIPTRHPSGINPNPMS